MLKHYCTSPKKCHTIDNPLTGHMLFVYYIHHIQIESSRASSKVVASKLTPNNNGMPFKKMSVRIMQIQQNYTPVK